MPNGLFPPGAVKPSPTLELAESLYKTPLLVRHGVRCGKAGCRCRRGFLHGPYAFLYWRDERSRQRRRYIRAADVGAVEQIATRRRFIDQEARRRRDQASEELRALLRWLRELERDQQA